MRRYIDADALIESIKNELWDWDSLDGITSAAVLKQTITDIQNAPTADVVERKRGEWIDEPVYRQTMDGKTWDGFTYCSECKEMHEYGYRSKFCPSCGSYNGEDEDNAKIH